MGLGALAKQLNEVAGMAGAADVNGGDKSDPCDYLGELLTRIEKLSGAVATERKVASVEYQSSGIDCQYARLYIALLTDFNRDIRVIERGARNRFRERWRTFRGGTPPR